MNYTFSVPDVSCGHCKARIESTLNGKGGIELCRVDLETKEVYVEGDLAPEGIIELIDEAGYDARLIDDPPR